MPTARQIALGLGAGALVASAVIVIAELRGDEAAEPRPTVDAGRRDAGPTTPRAPPADARVAPPGDIERANRQVASARGEAGAGRVNEALALLLQAYELDASPATLLEIAGLEQRMGRCREARAAALRVVAQSPGGELQQRAQQLVGDIGRCD